MAKINIITRTLLMDACKQIADNNTTTIENIKIADKKELSKDLKEVKKTIEYADNHLFIVVVDSKTGDNRKVSASGQFSENCVFLNIDANSYVAVVDDCNGGCFVRSYTRCSEKSTQYYWKSSRTKKCEVVNKSDSNLLIDGMKFAELMDKVKVCKGFRTVGKSKRMAEVEATVLKKAQTVAKKNAKLQDKINSEKN